MYQTAQDALYDAPFMDAFNQYIDPSAFEPERQDPSALGASFTALNFSEADATLYPAVDVVPTSSTPHDVHSVRSREFVKSFTPFKMFASMDTRPSTSSIPLAVGGLLQPVLVASPSPPAPMPSYGFESYPESLIYYDYGRTFGEVPFSPKSSESSLPSTSNPSSALPSPPVFPLPLGGTSDMLSSPALSALSLGCNSSPLPPLLGLQLPSEDSDRPATSEPSTFLIRSHITTRRRNFRTSRSQSSRGQSSLTDTGRDRASASSSTLKSRGPTKVPEKKKRKARVHEMALSSSRHPPYTSPAAPLSTSISSYRDGSSLQHFPNIGTLRVVPRKAIYTTGRTPKCPEAKGASMPPEVEIDLSKPYGFYFRHNRCTVCGRIAKRPQDKGRHLKLHMEPKWMHCDGVPLSALSEYGITLRDGDEVNSWDHRKDITYGGCGHAVRRQDAFYRHQRICPHSRMRLSATTRV
ncbi:hypothetical protein NM688_g1356 [Phlebia brevispora]|uniref:Uncharacterized protein n=1 Tax=Phlebia brevispora TaxID=194682 RepID=A0ACC1TBY8_9APHY|nr:hypothetical protein NM688_g1356 [Phlebia brevispora]